MSRKVIRRKTPKFDLATDAGCIEFLAFLTTNGFKASSIIFEKPKDEKLTNLTDPVGVITANNPHNITFFNADFEYRKTTDGKTILFHPSRDHVLDLVLAKSRENGLLEVQM
jgi:hypothetical protein